MHSSRMRTVRSSGHISGGGVPGPGVYLVPGGVPGPGVYLVPGGCTWSLGSVPGPWGGVPGPWGVYLVRGVPGQGVYLVPGGVYLVRYSPVDRQTPVKT